MQFTDEGPLPFGIGDLDAVLKSHPTNPSHRCVVKGCHHWLQPPCRDPKHRGDVCPVHGIRVHSGSTYSYADYRKNLIIDAEWFERHLRWNTFKYEAARFGQERSEDCLTFNVFRSFQHAGLLHRVVGLCTGINSTAEPRLFLWGLELKADGVEPWDLLIQARERFESDLPVGRPKTEPDIALFVPGQYVLLIEAKFTSPNGTYERDKKTKLFDLTIDQLVQIYHDESLKILDYGRARTKDRIHYQLWRNMTFAEFMALKDGANTRAFHASLVRAGSEGIVAEEFLTLVRPEYQDRFEQITWEQIYAVASRHLPRLERLCTYMENKTERFRSAFQISS